MIEHQHVQPEQEQHQIVVHVQVAFISMIQIVKYVQLVMKETMQLDTV